MAEPVVTTSASTTTTEATEPTTTTLDPEAADRAEIEDVLTRFHTHVYEVGFDPAQPGLDDVATSPVAERIRESVRIGAAAGYQIGDGLESITILEMSVVGDWATGTLCRLDQAPVFDADGREVSPFTPDPRVLEFRVRRTPDGWRVSDTTSPPGDEVPCDI